MAAFDSVLDKLSLQDNVHDPAWHVQLIIRQAVIPFQCIPQVLLQVLKLMLLKGTCISVILKVQSSIHRNFVEIMDNESAAGSRFRVVCCSKNLASWRP
jgi:hypothetical protein